MKKWFGIPLGALAAMLLAIPASASLIGDEVTPMVMIDDMIVSVDPPTATVGDGAEFEFTVDPISAVIDIDAEDIWITLESPFSEEMALNAELSIWLSGLQWRDEFGGEIPGGLVGILSVNGAGNPVLLPENIEVGFENEDLDVGRLGSSVHVSFGPEFLLPAGTSMIHLRLLVAHEEEPVIPEPATLGLFGIGLGGFAVRRGLSRKNA